MARLRVRAQNASCNLSELMKTISLMAAATLAFLPATLSAEKDGDHGNQDWAEKAARGYEEKALIAEKEGIPRAAAIYRRMAQIKRDAGAAAKNGQKFDWSEYHELEGKLNQIKQERHQPANRDKPKERPGEGFVRAAEEYRMQAQKARENGDTDKARMFMQLAEMKMAAARAAREGKDYDWTAYHELRKKLEGGNQEHDKPKHEAHHDKPKEQWHNDKPAERPAGGKLNIE